MRIEYDAGKRARTLWERALDFADAERVFAGVQFTFEDMRRDYRERRFLTVGLLDERMVVIGWTPRISQGESARRIFSMRKANEREIAAFRDRLVEGG
jgi:uncharacterized DUF497 family protein